MSDPRTPPVFDGHNDLLVNLDRDGGLDAVASALDRNGHISVEKAVAGGLGGGFFAIFVPSPSSGKNPLDVSAADLMNLPLPDLLPWQDALPVALKQAAILLRLQERGYLTICTTVPQIRATMAKGRMAAIMHMEGADAIDPDLHALEVLYAAGLRSLGPVWSRPTPYANGVPFRFPSTGDIGSGLTELGEKLIRRCNELRIMIDLSHLNEAGFWDVARLSDAPLVATHSNVHALCPSARNLTDKQLDAIGDSGGMVGLNYAVAFLRSDGQQNTDTPLSVMLAHLDHMIDRMGEDCVGLGSDFDGAQIPNAIADSAGLGALRQAMRDHGYDEPLIAKLCHENWMRVLERTWGN